MAKDSSDLSRKEQLKAENDFLKMKLMLEKGAEFGGENAGLHPEIENLFLKNIIEFERQFERQKMIKVFDKINRPSHFKPPDKIPDSCIDEAWKDLSEYLNKYDITLGIYSPNVSARELYRFTIEELFEYEMEDVNVPGIIHGFIYDEFHPDPVFDNTKMATEDCVNYILQKEPLEWTYAFRLEQLRLNDHYPLAIDEFKKIVNRFKAAYENLEVEELKDSGCIVNEKSSCVEGVYLLKASTGIENYRLSGKWKVVFDLDPVLGYWYINEVHIENIRF